MARIEYGCSSSGQIVRVADAQRGVRYTCPTCGLLLELRRGEQLEYFAHWRNLPGKKNCQFFSLGDGGQGQPAHTPLRRALPGVEDSPSELGLMLGQLDGRWGLALRVPEIPSDELGETSLGALRSALVDIYAGGNRLLRVSALDLRPGVGAARVDVVPSLQAFRTQPAGSWPSTIDKERWLLKSRGLEAKGALFRLRRGEWMRLLAGSGVHHGETLLILADARCAPPDSIVSETHARISSGGFHWTIWEVRLPSEPVASVIAWLARFGHEFVPRPWSVKLATPARAQSEQGEPTFWVDDSPVLTLEAPQRSAEALVVFKTGSNSHSVSVRASQSRAAHVGIKALDAGLTRLAIASERSASLDIAFIQRPARAALLALLVQTPRLRVWIGEQAIEAWQGSTHTVRVTSRELPEVRVDLGADSARARITVWERGKQRSRHGLDARNAERAIEAALSTASRIELDAENLGRLEFLPMLAAADFPRESSASDRLAWRDHVVSLTPSPERTAPTLLEQPRTAMSFITRRVGAAALVRARLALRRRHHAGGTRP